jgi:uncharacterized membrane protein YphA (DoxX/SURF4 family)
MNHLTRVFLVLLRLTIGWQFLVEGLEKVNSYCPTPTAEKKPWTSEPYLREASGPLGPAFHWMAGETKGEKTGKIASDHLLDRLTPLPDEPGSGRKTYERFPPALEKDWKPYFDRFVEHYQLDKQQRERAEKVFDQRKEEYVLWLDGRRGTRKVRAPAPPGSDTVDVEKEMPTLTADYRNKLQRVRDIEKQNLFAVGEVARDELRKAKAELNAARGVLVAALAQETEEMKSDLEGVLDGQKERPSTLPVVAASTIGLLGSPHGPGPMLAASAVHPDSPHPATAIFGIFWPPVAEEWKEKGPVPEPVVRRIQDWDRLDWIDAVTRWGLVVVGICLLAGLFTRSACVAGACFLLLFFLAMPPLPGLLENPKAEGHYLFLNKNIIEMFALLTLAATRSGRWLGLDGLLQFLNPRRWRRAQPVRGAARPAAAAPRDRSSPLSVKEPSHGY